MAPWCSLAFTSLIVMGALKIVLEGFGIALPTEFVVAPMVIFSAIGASAASFHWPKWALPPWYREYEKQKRAREILEREDKSTNRLSAD